MMSKAQVKAWVNALPNDSAIAIGEGGLDLEARYPEDHPEHAAGNDYDDYIEVGGWSLSEDENRAGKRRRCRRGGLDAIPSDGEGNHR